MGQNRKFWPGESISLPTLRQWSPYRIFYQFWAPHGRKLRISLFDHRATNWCFWPACDQNLGSVLLRCDHGVKFSKYWPGETSNLYAYGPESFLPGFFTPRPKIDKIWKLDPFGRTLVKKTALKFLAIMRPKWVKTPKGKLSRPLAASSRAKYSLQKKNLEIRPIWSHLGQKDRIEIFGRGVAKMGNKSWRETFGTIGVKVPKSLHVKILRI